VGEANAPAAPPRERLIQTRFEWSRDAAPSPGPTGGDWSLGTTAARIFEVGIPNCCALKVATASIGYIKGVGIPKIVSHRTALLDRLQTDRAGPGSRERTSRK